MNLKNHRRWTDSTVIKVACELLATGKASPTKMFLGCSRKLADRATTGDERKSHKRNLVIECHKIIASAI